MGTQNHTYHLTHKNRGELSIQEGWKYLISQILRLSPFPRATKSEISYNPEEVALQVEEILRIHAYSANGKLIIHKRGL